MSGGAFSISQSGLQGVNAGMQAVLFDVAGAYRGQEFPRVESLNELQSWLGREG